MRYKKLSTPIIRKKLDKGISAEANLDGSIFLDKSIKKGSKEEIQTVAHEKHHIKQFDDNILHYNDFNVTWKGKLYKRQDGMIEYNGKFYPEGHDVFPWEKEAVEAEHPYCMACFDDTELRKMKPPRDDSFDTAQEIKELQRIIIDKKFAEKYDRTLNVFRQVAKRKGIKDFDEDFVRMLLDNSMDPIHNLKDYFNRPRPQELAERMNLQLDIVDLKSAKTASYPSGHSAQAFLVALALGDKYPRYRKDFLKAAKKISYSRRVAHVHYKSDSKFGELVGKSLYKHIKNKS
tara:strand:+ start:3738 stop:4607 length:870 start_codon:yes stop_codon:yes gene_type:complete